MEKVKDQLILQSHNTKIYCGKKIMGEEINHFGLSPVENAYAIFTEKKSNKSAVRLKE